MVAYVVCRWPFEWRNSAIREKMESTRPQFYPNTLRLSDISKTSLESVLQDLRLAVKNSVDIISRNCKRPTDASAYGNVYGGIPGIVLTLLRLERQKPSIQQKAEQNSQTNYPSQDYFQLASDLIMQTPSDIEQIDGRLSPLASEVGQSFMRILAYCEQLNLQPEADTSPDPEDFRIFNQAVERATLHGPVYTFKGFSLGGDELIFGRAGLLWSLLTLKTHANLTPRATEELLTTRLSTAIQSIPKLVNAIIDGGKQGSQEFVKLYDSKEALPLMWQWMEGYYALGAMHGTTGILTMLLSCDLSHEQEQDIADTITSLCRICIEKGGHFPMSIPDRPDALTRPSPFVQLCHGPPGLLVLLGVVYEKMSFVERFWRPEWDVAIRLGTKKIWEEGLLSKGGNVCHGLTGNAWSLLSLHNIYEYQGPALREAKRKRMADLEKYERLSTEKEETLNGDYFLSRALPFMMLARESPPYSQEINIKTTFDFRAPDRPYSYGEGLAGQMCAWAETCAVIKARLRKMELGSGSNGNVSFDEDEQFRGSLAQQLGFFGLVINGPKSL
ncbi:lanthionine synthetase C family protein, putative [Talaromyces stipitatus ATCC 10500]|uniref:Lanthionine synthetase C family protein, putative n=1 Tax=Talaromyces stipitatus (strain ATCC 10500 / CBS 375.48 / QM 6759 / NRRL 1006) TaxID=441959 RepID=B8LUK2_TALSN|nr:lanthionine synthetase C family protein, putative [Talaromyces stipitatus ATCC 10500]EED23859.1 lanthionine synthetase C family protein, putative [Talaromyces stipitatus ATCC 10500]